MAIEPLIVGAPFGNYLVREGVTSTAGTFTWEHRAGVLKRIWRVMRTVRYNRRQQAWINKLGLPNPGLRSVRDSMAERIVSLHGFNEHEWQSLIDHAARMEPAPLAIELNISCPNVSKVVTDEVLFACRAALAHQDRFLTIAKLPPVRWLELAAPLYDIGIRWFHCCNTIPTPGGGVSGKPLKNYSLWAVGDLRDRFGDDVHLIGGGGVSCTADLDDFLSAGADHIAVASLLLNPLRWPQINRFRDHLRARLPQQTDRLAPASAGPPGN